MPDLVPAGPGPAGDQQRRPLERAGDLVDDGHHQAFSSSSDNNPPTPARSTVLSSGRKRRSAVASGTNFAQTTIFIGLPFSCQRIFPAGPPFSRTPPPPRRCPP